LGKNRGLLRFLRDRERSLVEWRSLARRAEHTHPNGHPLRDEVASLQKKYSKMLELFPEISRRQREVGALLRKRRRLPRGVAEKWTCEAFPRRFGNSRPLWPERSWTMKEAISAADRARKAVARHKDWQEHRPKGAAMINLLDLLPRALTTLR